jgi:hypothetical protein
VRVVTCDERFLSAFAKDVYLYFCVLWKRFRSVFRRCLWCNALFLLLYELINCWLLMNFSCFSWGTFAASAVVPIKVNIFIYDVLVSTQKYIKV